MLLMNSGGSTKMPPVVFSSSAVRRSSSSSGTKQGADVCRMGDKKVSARQLTHGCASSTSRHRARG
jgi:hypothetical protein